MKFKVLKDFISSVLNGVEGKIHDMELDEPTAKMWTEHGLIEEVKEEPEAIPTPELTQEPAPAEEAAPTPDAVPPEEVAPAVTQAPEAVTVDETK